MTEKELQELSEVIQSTHLNFLLGAGVSTPFLPVLGSIEKILNMASTDKLREEQYKKYLDTVMLPNKTIHTKKTYSDLKYKNTVKAYGSFFKMLLKILLNRKSTLLSKQVNVFTTNIDILMENVLEKLQYEYNDGFSGKFNPLFSIANFKKTIYQRSLHFEHVSEIPMFNIIKIHGSLTWKHNIDKTKILFSHDLKHFDYRLSSYTGNQFKNGYAKILVVNPEKNKNLETVLNMYYSELLRLYSNELEKENTSLFILGFSMEDQHIREITLRAAKSNPTLRIYIFCNQMSEKDMIINMETKQNLNIQIFTPPTDNEFYTLLMFTKNILGKILENI